jgi:hypothetical protein
MERRKVHAIQFHIAQSKYQIIQKTERALANNIVLKGKSLNLWQPRDVLPNKEHILFPFSSAEYDTLSIFKYNSLDIHYVHIIMYHITVLTHYKSL